MSSDSKGQALRANHRVIFEEALDFVRGLSARRSAPVGLCVVGDLAVDAYVKGTVERISPEAPVPVLNQESIEKRLGCAANVVNNLRCFAETGALMVHVGSVVGADREAEWLRGAFADMGPQVRAHLVVDSQRPTTVKTRFVVGSQQLLRWDSESCQALSVEQSAALGSWVESVLPQCFGLLLQDYAKGVLHSPLIRRLIEVARSQNRFVGVDPNRNTSPENYRGASLVTPNVAEAEALLGQPALLAKGRSDEDCESAARVLADRWGIENVALTRSAFGVSLVSRGPQPAQWSLPTMAQDVFDVTGAGDTLIAVLVGSLALGASLPVATALGMAAASVVVGRVGTATASLSEIQNQLEKQLKTLRTV